MKKYFLPALFAMLFASVSHAQHSDIEFGFVDPLAATPEFEIENDVVNNEGIQVAEGEISALFIGDTLIADNPGFITPAAEGLTVNEGDRIFVRVLNTNDTNETAIGNGFVNFYDPSNPDAGVQSDGGTITIFGNTPGSSADSVSSFDGGALESGSDLIFLATGANGIDDESDVPPSLDEPNVVLGLGEIHSHLVFNLQLDDASAINAVGLLLQFEADLASVDGDGIDVVSDPFFLVFNNGLDDEVFETQALAAFGVVATTAVPEPTAGILLAGVGAAMMTRRRRRRA